MANEIGEKLKEIRKKNEESLRTMANKLEISATYLSAIENGKRNVPKDFAELVISKYDLTKEEQDSLVDAVFKSLLTMKLDCSEVSNKGKELIRLVAENELDNATIDKLYYIANEKQKYSKQ